MTKVKIPRKNVSRLIDDITSSTDFIFSVTCQRRGNLYLKYEPTGQYDQGKDVREGDCSDAITREFIKGKGPRILLQPKGSERTMVVKSKKGNKPLKHWNPVGGKLPYTPKDKDLKLVVGMYCDAPKDFGTGRRIGRHGNWRPWCNICLRTVSRIIHNKTEYIIS